MLVFFLRTESHKPLVVSSGLPPHGISSFGSLSVDVGARRNKQRCDLLLHSSTRPLRRFFDVVVQIICSYSTLPLYAIVTQMGSSFKPAIFEEHVQEGLVEWAQKVKMKGRRATSGASTRPKEDGIQLQKVLTQSDPPPIQESRVEIVEVDSSSNMHDRNQNGNHKS